MLQQFIEFQITIHETNVIVQAEEVHLFDQHSAVALTFLPHHFRMRSSEDEVKHIGHFRFDRHQRIQRRFDALVGTEQAERRQHTTTREAVLLLHLLLVVPRHHVGPMWYNGDLVRFDHVLLAQDPRGAFSEHHHIRGAIGQGTDHRDALRRRRWQYRVECHRDGLFHSVQELQQELAFTTLVQTELMLDPHPIDARVLVHFQRQTDVIGGVLRVQGVRYFRWIIPRDLAVFQGANRVAERPIERAVQRGHQVLRVRGDAADSRRVGCEDQHAIRCSLCHDAFCFKRASSAESFTEATATRSSAAP